MNTDEYYMAKALNEAMKAYKKNEVPVGCVIVYKSKIISKGHNLRESSKDITKHAELIAIKKASRKLHDWRLEDCVMYVTLFPCTMCASAIVQSRINKLIIGAPTLDFKTKEIVYKIFNGNNTSSKIILNENILEKECKKILSDFFKKQRNKKLIS